MASFDIQPHPDGGFIVNDGGGPLWVKGNSTQPYLGPGPTDAGAPPPMLAPAPQMDASGGMPLPPPGPTDGGAPPPPPAAGPGVLPPPPDVSPVPAPVAPKSAVPPASPQPWVQRPDGSWGPALAAAPAPAASSAAAPLPKAGGAASKPAPPDPTLTAIDQAGKAQAGATEQLGKDTGARLEQLGKMGEQAAQETQQRLQAYQQHAQAIQQEGAQRLKDIDDAITGAGDAAKHYDPERWWKSRSEGQKVMGVIGLALGSVAESLGGKNVASEMINQAIERDNAGQRFRISELKDQAAAKSGALGHFMSLSQNSLASESAANAWAKEQAAQKIEALGNTLQSPIERDRAMQTAAQVRASAAMDRQKAQGALLQQTAERQNIAKNQLELDQMRAMQSALKNGQIPAGVPAINIGGRDVMLPPSLKPEQVTELQRVATAHSVVTQRAKALMRLVDQDPNMLRLGLGTPERRRQLGIDDILLNYGAAQGHTQGTPEPVIERFNEAVKPGKVQSAEEMKDVLKDIIEGANEGANASFNFHRLPGPGQVAADTEKKLGIKRKSDG